MKRIATDLAGTTDKKYKSGENSIQRSLHLCQQGIQLITQGKLTEAFHAYNNALKLDSQNATALAGRGDIFWKTGKFPEALQDLNAALNLNPQDTYALSRLGDVYRQLKRYKEALNDLNSVLTITPNDRFALEIKNVIYRAQGQLTKAIIDERYCLEIPYEYATKNCPTLLSLTQLGFFKHVPNIYVTGEVNSCFEKENMANNINAVSWCFARQT